MGSNYASKGVKLIKNQNFITQPISQIRKQSLLGNPYDLGSGQTNFPIKFLLTENYFKTVSA